MVENLSGHVWPIVDFLLAISGGHEARKAPVEVEETVRRVWQFRGGEGGRGGREEVPGIFCGYGNYPKETR